MSRIIKIAALIDELEDIATLCDLSIDAFKGLSYEELDQIIQIARMFKDRAEADWDGSGQMDLGEIWKIFKTKCQLAGARTELDEIRDRMKK